MTQRLLADRFGLAVRRETRRVSGYALVMPRSDQKLGPFSTPVHDRLCGVASTRRRGRRARAGSSSSSGRRWESLALVKSTGATIVLGSVDTR